MQCTQCHSDNVQKLSVIYHSGTQTIDTSSRTVGGGAGLSGLFGGGASTRTTGQSQSHLAAIVSPPTKKNFGITATIVIVSSLLLILEAISFGLFLLPLIVAVLLGVRAYLYNKNEWPPKYNEWSKSWHCNKCGAIYTL